MQSHFNCPAQSPALEAFTFTHNAYRISVLSDHLVRIEFAPENQFNDRCTQWVLNRDLPGAEYTTETKGEWLEIHTAAVCIRLRASAQVLRQTDVQMQLKDSEESFDLKSVDQGNYGGPTRTFDNCDGVINRVTGQPVELSRGFFSKHGLSILDDSESLAFKENGLVEPRNLERDYRDIYILAYGREFETAFRELFQLTGSPGILPRWALGIWWSRWFKYSDQDLLSIADEFSEHDAPLSAMVVDMDWHTVDNPHHSGWTGYSWNPKYFPEPEAFFNKLHAQGIYACLNLHPAAGVHPHEDAYPAMAKHMGIDPASETPVAFDITDPQFIDGYFKHLHHPLEAQGVDFWWIDWQQETTTKIEGLDPLWSLNHLHSKDIARDGGKRAMTFSRWGGAGSHRYPIGFAGDTYRSWDSLKYGIYYTALCSNVGYGWYSTDIGGFARGRIDHEMHTRWMQHAVWNPIYRLHNCGDPTLDYRPWAMEDPFKRAGIAALQMRNALLPYLYNVNFLHAQGGLPLVRPMYFQYDAEMAEHFPQQYLFGADILAAPVGDPIDPELGLARKVIWLPEGDWFDFFSGERIEGDRVFARYCDIETTPIYVRDGAAIPLANSADATELLIFPAAESRAELYQDDASSMEYAEGNYNQWNFEIRYDGQQLKVKADCQHAGWEESTKLNLRLRGFGVEDQVITVGALTDGLEHTVDLSTEAAMFATVTQSAHDQMLETLRPLATNCHYTRVLCDKAERIFADPHCLKQYVVDLEANVLRYLIETIWDAGAHTATLPNGKQSFVWWNRSGRDDFGVRINHREECCWTLKEFDKATPQGQYLWQPKSEFRKCQLSTHYFGISEDLRVGPERPNK